MKVLATISKTTKGHKSTWRFCEVDGSYFALRDNNKVRPCTSKDDLRSLFKTMTTDKRYGFSAVV